MLRLSPSVHGTTGVVGSVEECHILAYQYYPNSNKDKEATIRTANEKHKETI